MLSDRLIRSICGLWSLRGSYSVDRFGVGGTAECGDRIEPVTEHSRVSAGIVPRLLFP